MRYFALFLYFIIIFFTGCAKTPEEKELKLKDKNITIRLEGAVYPAQRQDILAEVGGIVKEVLVKNGDRVKKGDKIYEIDKTLMLLEKENLINEISTIESVLKNFTKNNPVDGSIPAINLAANELKKMAYLNSKGYINDFEKNRYTKNYINALYSNKTSKNVSYEKIKNLQKDLKNKKLELARLKYKIKHADGIAFIDGFVAGLNITKGINLGKGKKVGEIVNLDRVIVKAGFATGLLPYVKVGKKVRIDFITTPPFHTFGYIKKVSPIIDPIFDRMTLEIEVKNNNYILQDRTRALVTINLDKKEQEEVKKYFLNNKYRPILEIKSKI